MDSTNARDPKEQATYVFRLLTDKQLVNRYQAIELLNTDLSGIDISVLRLLTIRALNSEYMIGQEEIEGDASIADTRSWLLSALGRLSEGDDASTTEMLKHVDRIIEPNKWARYWALEGLIAGKSSRTREAAELVLLNEDDPLVAMLASAFLASTGDKNAQNRVSQSLNSEDPKIQWSALRALRVVLLPFAIDKLREIVERGEYSDASYDAIIALGQLPPISNNAPNVAQALSAAIVKMRGKPWQDGMRAAAITVLGKLRVESSGPLLVEELTDDNPAIVRQAVRSMQSILTLKITVSRIVEVGAKDTSPHSIEALGRALRWLDRSAVADELEGLMSSGSSEQQESSRAILSEIGGLVAFEKLRARTAASKEFVDTLNKAEERVSRLFEQSVLEAQKGFNLATWMDVAVFTIGMVLVVASAYVALTTNSDLGKWTGAGVGGAGVLGVLYSLFFSNPREQVRSAVDHLMSVKIIFLAYLRRLHQTDQSFTRLLLDNDIIPSEDLKSYSDLVGSIMKDTIGELRENSPDKTQKPGP